MWANLEYWIKIITPDRRGRGHPAGHPPVRSAGPDPGRHPAAARETSPPTSGWSRSTRATATPSSSARARWPRWTTTVDIYDKIRYFGSRNKILYVHFRNVSGTVPTFREEFINTGYVDMFKAMEIYYDVGFDSFFIDDHVPQTFQDTPGAIAAERSPTATSRR